MARINALGKKHSLPIPSFAMEAPGNDVPDQQRKFIGIWASEVGYGGHGRQAMLIINRADKNTIFGFYVFGPTTATSITKGPKGYNGFSAAPAFDGFSWKYGTTLRTARLLPQGDFAMEFKWSEGRVQSISLKPIWRLADAERQVR